MPSKIWVQYKKIQEIKNNLKIKTYLTITKPIVKEIIYKDINEYSLLKERLEIIKEKIKIYDIIEEGKDRLYIVIDNNEETMQKFDKLVLSEDLDIKREGVVIGHGNPVSKTEILNLFEMEKSMCKITYENKNMEIISGTGFFCEMENFPIKYALFTNNHILDKIKAGNTINIECLQKSFFSSYKTIEKEIKIDEKRRV